jgi:hypothetical protein
VKKHVVGLLAGCAHAEKVFVLTAVVGSGDEQVRDFPIFQSVF